ncbi:AraC family transcriptional regulator [Aestuariibacter halophilus]|uniref:AraC family transcriptional regulator n=1 Tax=Fluctibacter halophilus TaxID=226011 RepID=A0ABS8GAT3_9ALTE|nr:AraC family transcriptional regulator [Aestuariibacter halophilus]MCC2616824.1 AraC family transcriptional regulator [Aestuariibacter halophilus]
MPNTLRRLADDEHLAVALSPVINDIVKDVRLVYYAPDVYMPPHTHSVAQLSTLLCGQAKERTLNTEFSQTKGMVEYKPVAYQHSNQIGPNGALFLSINLDAEEDEFVAEFGHVNWHLSQVKQTRSLWRQLSAVLFNPANAGHVDLEATVLGMFSASKGDTPSFRQPPVWLLLAQQALHETSMNIQQIALDVGVHRVHLSRVFHDHFGLSISEYRQSLAVQKGIAEILSHRQTITTASVSAGFADQSHFTRTLKKHLGVTPKALQTLLAHTPRSGA